MPLLRFPTVEWMVSGRSLTVRFSASFVVVAFAQINGHPNSRTFRRGMTESRSRCRRTPDPPAPAPMVVLRGTVRYASKTEGTDIKR